jgi:hypothetical protein
MWETTNGKPPEPIIMICTFHQRHGAAVLSHLLHSYQFCSAITNLRRLCKNDGLKPLCWAKPACLIFFHPILMCRVTYWAAGDTLMSSLIHVMSNSKVPESIWAQNIPGIKIIMTLHEILGHPVLRVSFIQHYIQKWLILYSWSLYITETIIGASPQSIHSPNKQEHFFYVLLHYISLSPCIISNPIFQTQIKTPQVSSSWFQSAVVHFKIDRRLLVQALR